MKEGVKIIDENFRWLDTGIDWLVDQTDYLVIGVLGPQGAGKSTVLSLLAGNSAQDAYRNYVFQPQTKDLKEDALNQTLGVDMFVSPERIIFLDTQAALSAAILDNTIRQDKKFSPEYTSPENFVEMQSLQIASFLMTVCHVIIVAQDWFADLSFLRSLLTAEMLKPQTHTGPDPSTPAGASSQDEGKTHALKYFTAQK
jgi:protein SMG9